MAENPLSGVIPITGVGPTVERPRVLFILGAGHCGSTLLGLLLNAHPACVAVSEVSKLAESIAAGDPVFAQPEWRGAIAQFEAATGTPFAGLDFSHPRWSALVRWREAQATPWAEPRATLLSALAAAAGATWIVDGSKAWQQLHLLELSGRFDLRVVHLVRDVRGVVHSYARKYGELGHGLAKWIKPSVAAMVMERQFPGRWLRVRYEDLARDPAATLARICALIDLDYDPAMLRFRAGRWLGIGGNRMSHRTDDTIRLDEKWRREMSWRDRVIVGAVGGALNRYYGY